VVHVESVAAVQSSRSIAVVATESGEDPPRQPEKSVLGHEFDFQQYFLSASTQLMQGYGGRW
jgi:hypothetical protein